MNLQLFHANPQTTARKSPVADKFNGSTGRLSCRLLEWTGWYNYNMAGRLLGHYRLFQPFKTQHAKQQRHANVAQVYVIKYKHGHSLKNFFSVLMSAVYFIGTGGKYYMALKVMAINRQLINEKPGILQEFLTSADTNFELALRKAMQKIDSPAFFNNGGEHAENLAPTGKQVSGISQMQRTGS